MQYKLILTFSACLLAACETFQRPDSEPIAVSYSQYRKIACARTINGYCVEKRVGLDAEAISSLIFHASLRMRENYPSKGVRMNEALSDIYKTRVVEIVAGSYRMRGKNIFDATEEVSVFKLKGAEWVHLETSTSFECSS